MCKMLTSPIAFFHIFMGREGVKAQKLAQTDKQVCLSHSVSQEAYLI